MFAVVAPLLFLSPAPPAQPEVLPPPMKWSVPEPYRHLPGEKDCEAGYNAANYGAGSVIGQAIQLGYYDMTEGWMGGGWHAHQFREAYDEQKRIAAIYWAAWWVTWTKSNDDQRAEWAEALYDMIGHANYVFGRLP